MTYLHYIGAALVLLLITGVGFYSGRKVKSASDFVTGARKAGAGIVTGSLIGTMVGGASTIGTAQLAFKYGFSAWWFTLGSGIACLVMAAFFVKPFYDSGISTMPQIFLREYGPAASMTATLLTSIGSFLSIVSQVLSGIALITAVSALGAAPASVAVAILMLFYVVFGGVWGAGYVGITKTILLYASVSICGVLALKLGGGLSAFRSALPAGQYFSLTARGGFIELGECVSMVVGVLTTQAYIMAVISARSLRASRAGVLASAVLIPLIGIAGIFVGMYMKLHYPGINSAAALPLFILEKLPPLFGGVVIAALLVAVVGTGAGVALGLSCMIGGDIYKAYINRNADDGRLLAVSRLVIIVILAAAVLFSNGSAGSMILSWSFMSMGLRGAAAVGALCTAFFLPGRIDRKFAVASMFAGPAFVLVGYFILPPGIDPLFLGIGGAAAVLAIGLAFGYNNSK